MDQFPATQTQNGPAIFLNDDGRALRIFVEACGIIHRPKVVRALKKAGADICGDPKQAQIILVDARTIEGRKFIRDWGNDVDKVVLEYGWASKSLAAGKALKATDQWGNCLTKDDGLPLDPDANFDEEVDFTNKSPLPTPRVTPVDASVAREKVSQRSRVSVNTNADASETTNVITQDQQLPPYEPPASVVGSLSSAQHDGPQCPAIGNEVPSTPMPQFTPYQQSMAQPFYPMQHPIMMQSIAQQFWAQMFNTDPFAMSLVDSMRNHGIVPHAMPQSQGGPVYQQPGSSNLSPHEVIQPPVDEYPREPVSSAPRLSTPSLPASISRKPKPSTNGHPPQVGRRSARRPRSASPPEPTASSAPKAKRQKRREKSPEARRKGIAYIGPSYPTKSPTRATQEDRLQKVFVSDKGRPIIFFVQIDQPNRFNVVSLIKKNGGKISNTQTAADYAVLYSHSTTFMDLLTSTIDAGKTAVTPAYIHDSVKEGSLLDPAQYRFKLTGKFKKRTAILSSSSDVEELATNEAVAMGQRKGGQHGRRQHARKRVKQEPQAQSSNIQSTVKLEPQEVEIVFERPRVPSPTPPPEHTQQRLTKGYKYSDVEREYTLKYARILLEREPQMSSQAIADRLYKKMQHHPFQSWRSYISTGSMRDDIEKIRKKATIAYRKAMEHKHPEIVKEEPQDMDLNGTGANVAGENEVKKDVEEDLDIICNFFAYGGGDEQNDGGDQDTIWARLSSKATCKTSNSWVEFYDHHYPIIQDRYTKLTELAAKQNPPNNDCGPVNKESSLTML
ncbi:hypothetical protein APHAL10511_006425 [Amanita phalloides]|nr:hypothetical protein APHAL10511_006425 [Amanita phalloides]